MWNDWAVQSRTLTHMHSNLHTHMHKTHWYRGNSLSSTSASVALMTIESVKTRLAFVKIRLPIHVIIYLTNEVGKKELRMLWQQCLVCSEYDRLVGSRTSTS